MKKDITIVAEPRSGRGKNEARRLRVRGLAPAIVYGTDKDAVAVSVSPKELNKILHSATGHNTIFNVQVDGGVAEPVMIIDWQNDPIRGNLLHVDLKRIDMTARLRIKVPIYTVGEPKGVKQQSGLLELVTREVEIECLPEDIPERFTVDVSELMIGESVRASQIALTGSMKLVSQSEAVLAHCVMMRAEEEPEPAAEGAAPAATSEPEVIKKGKKEEDEAAEAEGKKKSPEAEGKKKK